MTIRVHGQKLVNEGDVPVRAYTAVKALDFDYSNTSSQSVALTDGSIPEEATHIVVRLIPTTACWVRIGPDPTGQYKAGILLGAFQELMYRVEIGHKVAVVRDTANGTMQITILE